MRSMNRSSCVVRLIESDELKNWYPFRQESVVHGVSTRLGDGTLLRQHAFSKLLENLAI